ncbi:MAG: hypothetical protein ACREMB_27250 [Candidatus Rokuibacteriota bacterium]
MSDAEAAARDHARRIVTGDAGVLRDLAAGAVTEPADLLDRLLEARFHGFELVAHARIGAYHIFKTRYIGPSPVVVQVRWVPAAGGGWQVAEAAVARGGVDEGA